MNKLTNYWSLALLLGLVLVGGCVDPYPPDVPAAGQSYLVVDGFLNSQGITTIKLSRSQGLAAAASVVTEPRAMVTLRDNVGTSYALTENPAGTYSSAALTLDPARQYQLRISTSRGRVYLSDPVPVKTTPPIDHLTWEADGAGVRVFVSAHGLNNDTRYYRWDYAETWQFTSAYYSPLEYKFNDSIGPRTNNIFTCWRSENSTAIFQANTIKQAPDVVANYPLVQVPYTNEKLRIKYSVLVQQHAQTAAEYEYWDTLRKNTQNIGTLNDPLPTQLTGNVHCTSDPSEPVLGFVSAHSVTQQRLFIDYNDLPRMNIPNPAYDACVEDTVYKSNAPSVFRQGLYIPYSIWYDKKGVIIAYFASTAACVDCRLRGTNVKPSFWP